MDAVQVLRLSAEFAFQELLDSLKDVDQPKSWATAQPIPGEYLHTAGSTVAIVQHIAMCKFGYATCAFTDCEVRGRDTFAKAKEIGPDWEQSKNFLLESQDYWMNSWANLASEELESDRHTIWMKPWPAWKIITRVIHHDQYHAGQIALIQSILPGTDVPPDMMFDQEERAYRETPYW